MLPSPGCPDAPLARSRAETLRCCCFRIWDHPAVTKGAPAMRASYKSCGHMELDYRPEISAADGSVPTDTPGLPRTGPHRPAARVLPAFVW